MILKKVAKAIVPRVMWDFVRERREFFSDLFRNYGRAGGTLSYCGYRIRYTNGMTIVARVRREGVFERTLCEKIVRRLGGSSSSQPIFLDIGSNIGLISAYIASRVPAARIYAFDPGKLQYELFSETLRINGLQDRVELSDVAFGDHDGEELYYVHDAREISKDGFRDTRRGGATRSVSVRVERLDMWWHEMGRPDISAIKIDTEGAELLILRGGEECITAVRPHIYLEIEPRNLKAYEYHPADILEWFVSHGYRLSSLHGTVCSDVSFLNQCIARGEDTYVGEPMN